MRIVLVKGRKVAARFFSLVCRSDACLGDFLLVFQRGKFVSFALLKLLLFFRKAVRSLE